MSYNWHKYVFLEECYDANMLLFDGVPATQRHAGDVSILKSHHLAII